MKSMADTIIIANPNGLVSTEFKLNNNCKLRETKVPTVVQRASCETQTCGIQTDSFFTGISLRDASLLVNEEDHKCMTVKDAKVIIVNFMPFIFVTNTQKVQSFNSL